MLPSQEDDPGGSPNIKVVGVPIGNLHKKSTKSDGGSEIDSKYNIDLSFITVV